MNNKITPEIFEEIARKIQVPPEPRKYTCSICGREFTATFPYISRKTWDAACDKCIEYERRLVHNCLLRGKRKDFRAYKRYTRNRHRCDYYKEAEND